MIKRFLLMNQNKEHDATMLTVEISPQELSHLEDYRKLSDDEKENIDGIIKMCLKSNKVTS